MLGRATALVPSTATTTLHPSYLRIPVFSTTCEFYFSFSSSKANYCSQLQPPVGWDAARLGIWPQQGAWVVKVRVPPSWRSSRTPGNFHTVTLLFAHERDPANNPLLMGAGLEQLLCWHCTCKAGLRTVSSCTHRNGVLILLCATQCCDSAKVQESLYVDTARSVFMHIMITALLAPPNITHAGRTPTSLSSPGLRAPTLLVTRPCCTGWCHDRSTPHVTPGPTRLEVSLLDSVSQPTPLR